ncbi:MAG: hypothetical protein ICV72_10035 [Aldersonia sp.]|nr:hypothetical protein [Aldersonia sp.]
MATYDDWLAAYSEVYEAIPEDVAVACPNCGHKTLRLVFTGDLHRAIGYGHFWCDTCFQGIGISRAPIPDGAIVQDIHLPHEEREPKIPNFILVS